MNDWHADDLKVAAAQGTVIAQARQEGYREGYDAGVTEGRKNYVIDGVEVSQEELIERLKSSGAPSNAREVAEAMAGYLNARACLSLFAKVLLYKACGESPRVKVTFRGFKFRVSLERENGEVEHFNRDGEA